MRATAILLLLLVLPAGALAQGGGYIGIYTDLESYSCFDADVVPLQQKSYYVIHHLLPQAKTSQFKVEIYWPELLSGSVDFQSNLVLGDIYTGVLVEYVGCKPLPHLVAVLYYLPLSAPAACSAFLRVVGDPSVPSGNILVTDCADQTLFATGGILYVGADSYDSGCRCGSLMPPVATEPQTWGAIKALYR